MTFLNNNQTNYHFEYSIYVNNSRQKVWDYLVNVARWKEWDTEIIDAKLFGSFTIGAKGILTPQKGPKLKFHISETISNTSYTFVTQMPIGTLVIKRSLEQNRNQIKFTDEIQFTGFLKRFFGLLLGKNFQSVLPDVMQKFKELVEKE